ncbi:MAG: DegT/DnrJ/EryC1/StrS family aminotransferase [Synechococcus sp.]
MTTPPSGPFWPHYDEEQLAAVAAVLASGRVNHWTGEEGRSFEREFAAWCGVPHALTIANGTLALAAAYRALGLGPGDELITTPRSFVATASAAVLLGVKPVFADVDPDSQCLTAATVAPLIGPRTRAIAVVHLNGWPAPLAALADLAQAHGLGLVEDCAQAHGAGWREDGTWRSVGSVGAVAAWSFCQDKIISTGGEGGMVTTGRDDLHERLWSLRDHGKTLEALQRDDHPPGFRWLHDRFGSNFRLTEMQSAIGRVQLRRLPAWRACRQRQAALLSGALADLAAVRVPMPPAQVEHAWYRFHAFVRPEALAAGWSRDRILAELAALGLPSLTGSCSEIYRERSFAKAGLAPPQPLPVARQLGETSLMLPLAPTLPDAELERWVAGLRQVLAAAAA